MCTCTIAYAGRRLWCAPPMCFGGASLLITRRFCGKVCSVTSTALSLTMYAGICCVAGICVTVTNIVHPLVMRAGLCCEGCTIIVIVQSVSWPLVRVEAFIFLLAIRIWRPFGPPPAPGLSPACVSCMRTRVTHCSPTDLGCDGFGPWMQLCKYDFVL